MLDVKSLQEDGLNYKIMLPVGVIGPGQQPIQLFFCLHRRSYITSCYNGIEHRGQMEPAPQGEMWLDDTQMAHTVETSICLCIKTTGFIGVFEDCYGFQAACPVLQVVTLCCVEKSSRQLWQELLCLLSEDAHLFALIQFIQNKWQKSFVCLSSNVLINAFVSVKKKMAPTNDMLFPGY